MPVNWITLRLIGRAFFFYHAHHFPETQIGNQILHPGLVAVIPFAVTVKNADHRLDIRNYLILWKKFMHQFGGHWLSAESAADNHLESANFFSVLSTELGTQAHIRSEERRVGKECVSTCRSR